MSRKSTFILFTQNFLQAQQEARIPIVRLCCKICSLTISLLPSFLLPYFQYSLAFILKALNPTFSAGCKDGFQALFRFYKSRFLHNLNRLEMFLRDNGFIEAFPNEPKEKAIKILCVLTVPTAETFSQRFHQHYKRNFMAR